MPTALGVVERFETNERLVALTFDDGPSEWTEMILDTLGEHSAHATFFVRGSAVTDETTETVRRALLAGCDIGNHTHNHVSYDTSDDATARREFLATHRLLQEVTGGPPTLTRPPYGRAPERLDEIAASLGYRATIMWSIATNDWEEPQPNSDLIVSRVLDDLEPGSIVLLHDGWDPERGPLSRQETVTAVGRLLPELHARQFRAVSISELIGSS
jgi:peptidoglycan/xylan/chitin deacetylase (PgdA/CDA1 family)